MKFCLVLSITLLFLFAVRAEFVFTSLKQATDYGCYDRNFDTCYYCEANGVGNYYRAQHYSGDSYPTIYSYSYSCGNSSQIESAIQSPTCDYDPCTFYYESVYQEYNLELDSINPIRTKFLTEYGSVLLSNTTASVTGGDVTHILFSADYTSLQVKAILSADSYLTNFGVMNFGQQYTIGEFTFTLTNIQRQTIPDKQIYPKEFEAIDLPIIAVFIPFFGISIDTMDKIFIEFDEGELAVAGSIEKINTHIAISNPLLHLEEVALYPPYTSEYAEMVFRLPSSGYFEHPCYYYESTLANYECEFSLSFSSWFGSFGSFSGSFSSFFSFSPFFDKDGKKATSADEMAFDLF